MLAQPATIEARFDGDRTARRFAGNDSDYQRLGGQVRV